MDILKFKIGIITKRFHSNPINIENQFYEDIDIIDLNII